MFNDQSSESKQNWLLDRAQSFLETAYVELGRESEWEDRWKQVQEEIIGTGTWIQTAEELTQGARMAWRNSNRCIGRLFWKTLKVIDARHLEESEDIFKALQHHIDFAFNGGDIRSTITIFRQKMPGESDGPRILNHQLVRYAGHVQPEGSVLGDPAEKTFTSWCKQQGYSFEGTAFDLLPHAIQWPGKAAMVGKWTVPDHMRVPLSHPENPEFAELGLEWYALPVISGMLLEIGGVSYTAAPFNGWYMGTEIGSRNLGDVHRYNLLPKVAAAFGLDTSDIASLWKDRALLELNRAVLHSFEKAGITVSNHHEAASQFLHFEESERKKGREITADWSWIAPPMSSSATPVFHRQYDNTVKSPNFFYQDPIAGEPQQPSVSGCPFHRNAITKAVPTAKPLTSPH